MTRWVSSALSENWEGGVRSTPVSRKICRRAMIAYLVVRHRLTVNEIGSRLAYLDGRPLNGFDTQVL
jgi:hypothetical protein